MPLSLTILTAAFPAERRGLIVDVYGGLAGLAVAAGPLIGGAITQSLGWPGIFWLNVPIGLVAVLPYWRTLGFALTARATEEQWAVTECAFLPDWVGTRPTFTITPVEGDGSGLHFQPAPVVKNGQGHPFGS